MKEQVEIIDICEFDNYSDFIGGLIHMEYTKKENVYTVYVEIDGHKAGANYNASVYTEIEAFDNFCHDCFINSVIDASNVNEDYKKFKNEYESMSNTVNKFSAENTSLKKENYELKEQLDKTEYTLSGFRTRYDHAISDLKNFKNENEELKEQLITMHQMDHEEPDERIEEMRCKIIDLENENAHNKITIDYLNSELAKVNIEKENFLLEIRRNVERIEFLNGKVSAYEKMFSELRLKK